VFGVKPRCQGKGGLPTFDEGEGVDTSAVVQFERSPNRRCPVRPNLLHEIYGPFARQIKARCQPSGHTIAASRFDGKELGGLVEAVPMKEKPKGALKIGNCLKRKT